MCKVASASPSSISGCRRDGAGQRGAGGMYCAGAPPHRGRWRSWRVRGATVAEPRATLGTPTSWWPMGSDTLLVAGMYVRVVDAGGRETHRRWRPFSLVWSEGRWWAADDGDLGTVQSCGMEPSTGTRCTVPGSSKGCPDGDLPPYLNARLVKVHVPTGEVVRSGGRPVGGGGGGRTKGRSSPVLW
jgi:hypothetical protein